jgi:hypothetical protein
MNWIDEITKVYSQYFKGSFDKLGLLKYEEVEGQGMGALIKFKNHLFRVQILNDRGILETEISSLFGAEQFRGIEMFSSFLSLQQLDNKVNQQERSRILCTRLDYSGQRDFLVNNDSVLAEIRNKENYIETLKRIDALGQERFDLQFRRC